MPGRGSLGTLVMAAVILTLPALSPGPAVAAEPAHLTVRSGTPATRTSAPRPTTRPRPARTVPQIPLIPRLKAGERARQSAIQKHKAHRSGASVTARVAGATPPAASFRIGPAVEGPAGTIATVAGTGMHGSSGDGGPATSALLQSPTDVKIDGSGSFAISADYAGSASIRHVDQAGVITSVPGASNGPYFLDPTPDGSYYYEDGYVLGYVADDGSNQILATNQAGQVPGGVLVDGSGNVYFGGGYGITEITAAGAWVDLLDGTVCDMAFDALGNIVFSGYTEYYGIGYSCTGIGKIDADDQVTQIVSNQPADVNGIAVDLNNDVVFTRSAGEILEYSGGQVSVIAGTGTNGYGGDGGPAGQAQLDQPTGVTFDQSGNLLVADTNNERVRIIYGVGTAEAGAPVRGPQAPPPPPPPPTPPQPIPSEQTYSSRAFFDATSPDATSPDAASLPSADGCGCQAPLSQNSAPDAGRGDPVNTATGAFSYNTTDASLPGRGVTFDMARSYTSADTTVGTFGAGWVAPYGASLTIPAGAATITFRSGSGAQAVFSLSGSTYVAPPGVRSVLAVVSGGYSVSNPDGTAMTFSGTGQLTSIVDRHGEGVTLRYTSGKLTTVVDAAGRVATFTYTGSLLTKLSMPGSRSVTYGYTGGRLTSVTDLVGKTWRYSYDASGRLEMMTSPRGNVLTTNTYDSTGRVSSQVDANNQTTTFGWSGDSSGNGTATTTDPDGGLWTDVYSGNVLTSVTDPDGRTISYGYDADNNRTEVVDAAGHSTHSAYDAAGNMLSKTDALSNTETWTYNGLDEPLTATDRNGNTSTYTYDSAGDRLTATTPAGYQSTWTYNLDGTLATSVNPLGNATGANASDYTTSYGYDGVGQLVSVTDPLGNKTTHTYDSSGRGITTVDPRGNAAGGTASTYTKKQSWTADDHPYVTTEPGGATVTRTYDADHNLATITDANANKKTYGYDGNDRLISALQPNGHGTTLSLDWAGRTISSTDPNGNVTTHTYDKAGQLITTTRPRGNVAGATAADYTTTYSYDPVGRLTSTSRPQTSTVTAVVKNGYDADGNLTSTTDANNQTTTFTYDGNHNKLSVTTPEGFTTSWTYTVDNQVAATTDGNQHQTNYTYAASHQLASITDPDSRTTSNSYDRDGRLATKAAPDGLITTFGYDAASNLATTNYSDGTTHSAVATYNAKNQRTKMVDATGTTTETYDSAGNLKTIRNGPGKAIQYTYTADELPATIVYPANSLHTSGRTVTQTYDNADQLTSVKDWLGNTTSFVYDPDSDVSTLAYPNGVTDTRSYDYSADVASISDTGPAGTLATFNYSFAANSQLTSESNTLNGATVQSNYTYTTDSQLATDAAGNYSQDPARQLTGLPGGTSLSYDNAGQLTSTTTGSTSTGYSYNSRGDRTTVTPTTGTPTNLGYDQADQLSNYSAGASTVAYKTSGDGLRTTATGATTATYTWNPVAGVPLLVDDNTTSYLYGPTGPIEQITDTNDTPTYLQGDHQSSTRLLTNAAGVQVATYTYSSYGSTTSHTGTATATLRYDGQYTDPASGLIYLRARYYDPATAQFLTRDPLEARTRSAYGYADGDPLDAADPTGLCSLFSWGGDGCAAAAAAAVPGGNNLDDALTSFVSFGDQVTFGVSRRVRHLVGLAGAVDECSAAYSNLPTQAVATIFMFANGEGEIAAAKRVSELAVQFGRDGKEIRNAIHAVKGAAKFARNPDVAVARNGEVHPIGGDGKLGDSIGNIYDFLRG